MTVFNRKKTTLRCLEDLKNQQYDREKIRINVYLTNDGCTDGTPEAVKEEYPEVKIVEGDGTLFWNRGMYTAWLEAAKDNPDFYLWLNDDTFLYNDCIERLLMESEKNDNKVIVVGSTCEMGNQQKITYGGWRNFKLITNLQKPQRCDTINGNIVLIPKAVYEILGTNDPYYRHVAGDTDYGLRAKANGVPVYTGVGVFGECNLHIHPTIWMNPSQLFIKRWENFFSPIGNNPFELFYLKKRHYGLFSACITFCTNWIHFLLPWLWPNSYKNNQ